MGQIVYAVRWYLAVQVFGLAAVPLAWRLFRRLPDRGYGVSKPLGLLLTGWLFWLLTTFGWTHNSPGGVLFALLTVAGVGLWLLIPHRKEWLAWLQARRNTILVTEVLFAVAFIAWAMVRAHMPRIQTAGGEKWMEIAFLRAILRSDTFPPHDPWLSGFAISYYYFGYVIVAMLTRLAAVPPGIAFNLGLATLFALVSAGAFSLAYNLRRIRGPERTALVAGLLAVLLLVLMGNLEGSLEMLHARGFGTAGMWAWLDIPGLREPPPLPADRSWSPQRFFWWWQASRVVQDYAPWGAGQEVIDEFPAFSFILGDMHPHVLSLPFVLLALSLALNLALQTPDDGLRGWWRWGMYALCLGGLGFLNTWDFPIYLSVVVAAYLLALWLRRGDDASIEFYIRRGGGLFAALLVAGIGLYLPFWLGFRSQAGGLLLNVFNATRLPQFLVMFGPFLFIGAVFVVGEARRSKVTAGEVARWAAVTLLAALSLLALTVGMVVVLVRLNLMPARGAMEYVAAWVRGEPIPGLEGVFGARDAILRGILAHFVNPWTAILLIAFLVAGVLTLLRRGGVQHTPEIDRAFVLLLWVTGAALALVVEYVYLRDHFGTRMNTVFKFYFQAWVMWAIAGGYALTEFIGDGRRIAAGVAGLLILAGLVYPVLAIPARSREYGGPPTLDGEAYLASWQPDDYGAIAWLNATVAGAPVILEAPGDHYRAYVYEGRVSAHTGLPTLLGWGGHEHQWRGDYTEPARREEDIQMLYVSSDLATVRELLDEYGVVYVYVGPLERERYPASGLEKFAALGDVVYQTGGVTIYRVR